LESEWLPHERRIRLLAGQAFFRVAGDKQRPFVVTAGGHTVTALGTVFDVNLDDKRISVTLVEGRVTVSGFAGAAGRSELELHPSQQLVAAGDGTAKIRSVDTAVETAWADGKMVFVDMPLLNAVTTMNQYSAQQIIADPSLAQYRINGIFRVGNQESFVDALTAYFPIDARNSGDGRIVLAPRGSASPKD
jgi:transmembrane sensor